MITPMITPIATARHPLTPASGTLVTEGLGSGDLPPPPSAPPAASMPAIELPAGWQCESSRYGGSDGCDCGCGAYDPARRTPSNPSPNPNPNPNPDLSPSPNP